MGFSTHNLGPTFLRLLRLHLPRSSPQAFGSSGSGQSSALWLTSTSSEGSLGCHCGHPSRQPHEARICHMCNLTHSCLLPWEAEMPSEPLVLGNREDRVGREGTSRKRRQSVDTEKEGGRVWDSTCPKGSPDYPQPLRSSAHLWNITSMALQGQVFCKQAVHTGLLCF